MRKLPARPTTGRGRRKRAADFFKEELPTTSSQEPGSEVLDKAYQAAMALTAVPPPRNNASPHVDTRSTDDSVSESPSRPQGQSGLLPGFLSESESSRKRPSGIGLSPNDRAPDAVDELAGAIERGEGSRAVEAEGLIWVDSSQQTAYSVR